MKTQEQPTQSNALWRIRRKRGLEPKQVGWLLGHKSPDIVSGYERGSSQPNLNNALKLSVIYSCTVEDLFSERLEAFRTELASKVLKIPGFLALPADQEILVEQINKCSYESLLDDQDPSEKNSQVVRSHITKLAKQLAGL